MPSKKYKKTLLDNRNDGSYMVWLINYKGKTVQFLGVVRKINKARWICAPDGTPTTAEATEHLRRSEAVKRLVDEL